MRRRPRILGAVVAVVALAFAAFVATTWLALWDGAKSDRELTPGSKVVLESGLTLTVPEGYSGHHTTYFEIPAWLPVGQNLGPAGPFIAETMNLSADDRTASPSLIVSANYFRGDPQRPHDPIARSRTVSVYRRQDDALMVMTTIPGKRKSYILFRTKESADLDAVRALWRVLRIRGAVPPGGAG